MQNVILDPVVPAILAQQGAGGGAMMSQLLFFGLFFAAMWFLLIAPQRKKQKLHRLMLESLSTGDEIVTTGGIHGVITNVKDDRFVVRIAEGTKVELGRGFVHSAVKKGEAQ